MKPAARRVTGEIEKLTTSSRRAEGAALLGFSSADIAKDLDSRHICVGGATADDLVGAALTAADISERECLESEAAATQLMTVVLHDMAGKTNLLVAVIPLNGEAGELIANLTLRLRELLFVHSLYLVFSGGGGRCQGKFEGVGSHQGEITRDEKDRPRRHKTTQRLTLFLWQRHQGA